jgi:hypothetical protein
MVDDRQGDVAMNAIDRIADLHNTIVRLISVRDFNAPGQPFRCYSRAQQTPAPSERF